MDIEPLVSVIIPFYSNINWLQEAIESVIIQTYKNIEIIVINDGSKEDYSQIKENYTDRVLFIEQENKGPGAARNNGINHSLGEYITFLDSDDLWLPEKIKLQVEFMEEHNEVEWSHCAYETFGSKRKKVLCENTMKGMLFPKCFITCKIATPCVIIRRNVFQNTNFRFSEKMRYGQDYYLWVLLCNSYYVEFLPKVLCKVRFHGNNAARRCYAMLKSKSELWEQLSMNNFILLNKIPLRIRYAYKLCKKGYLVVDRLNNKNKSFRLIEFISKILYLIPYLILKTTKIK